jgi:D-glycero-D-manno-heptose 1,7-bisphosphate phosphatase
MKAAFLDRDGTINVDHGYIDSPERFEFVPGAIDALRLLQGAGYLLVVVTNQSGIGRGKFGEAQYQAVTAHMQAELAKSGVTLAAVYHCPHHPAAWCPCRKPKPGMIHAAASDLGIDLGASVMFGDLDADEGAAKGLMPFYRVTLWFTLKDAALAYLGASKNGKKE